MTEKTLMSSHPNSDLSITPIAILHSPFKEKFGVPRQPALAQNAIATIEVLPPFDRPEAFRGIDNFSHLWLTFVFHQHLGKNWSPTIRPPRLGGNQRTGVFASRAPFRPNHLGLSVVRLLSATLEENHVVLTIAGADLVDQTPIMDIKPYIPYTDSVPDAQASFAQTPPVKPLNISWSQEALNVLRDMPPLNYPNFKALVDDIVSADPRPAYKGESESRIYGIKLFDKDVKFQVTNGNALITSIDQA